MSGVTETLPHGFRVRIYGDVRVSTDGRVLVGGTPMRAIKLSSPAQALISDGVIDVRDDGSRELADRLLAVDMATPDLDGPPCGNDELTVVIPVRDRDAELGRLLARLTPALRCVVVDDGSLHPAAVADAAREYGADLVQLDVNQGPAAARNAGFAQVTTPYAAFVDSDVTVDPETLTLLTRHFTDPKVAIVAPIVRGHTSSATVRWFQTYDEIASSLDLGERPALVHPSGAVAWLPSACLVVRTDPVDGGFDPTMRVGEDVDLVWRTIAAGWRVRYDPSLEARHEVRTSARAWLGRKFVYGSGGASLAARHGDLLAPAVMSPTYALVAVGLLAQRRWTIPLILVAAGRAFRSVDRAVGSSPGTRRIAVEVVGQGFVWTVRQEAALLLRHWWPLTALALPFSRNVRRATVAAVMLDVVAFWPHRNSIRLPAFVAARRLDDLAYGAGLWWGAWRARSSHALRPRLVRR